MTTDIIGGSEVENLDKTENVLYLFCYYYIIENIANIIHNCFCFCPVEFIFMFHALFTASHQNILIQQIICNGA